MEQSGRDQGPSILAWNPWLQLDPWQQRALERSYWHLWREMERYQAMTWNWFMPWVTLFQYPSSLRAALEPTSI